MARELALITARNNRNKKKKEQLELQAPARKTVSNNTIQNKKTTQASNAKKNTTVDTKPTVQRTSNNMLSFNNRNTSKPMLSTPKRDNTTVKTSDVNKNKNKKSSITTVDIYTKNGRFYYDDNGKQHEVDRDAMMKAWNNNRSGVVGRIDKKGKFQETDSRGVSKQELANKNYNEKLSIYNKAQETLNQKRSKEYAKRGVDLSTQSNLQLNPQNQMLNFANRNEQTKNVQQRLTERTAKQQPLIEEANKQLEQEREAVNKATNEYALAKYLKNYEDVENQEIGYKEKTFSPFTTGIGEVVDFFGGDNKYVDENGKVTYLPSKASMQWNKIRNSYGDNFVGKLARFAGDVSHEAGKQAAAIGLNAVTGGIGGTALYFSDIAADQYKQNINEGYGEDKALIDSFLKTGQNYIKQKLIGGLGGKLTGGGPSWLEKSLNNTWAKAVKNPVFSRTLASMSAEGIDEFTDTWIEGAIDSAVLGKEFSPVDLLKESLYSGAIGGATGAFGGMTDRVTSSINDNALAQQQLYELNTIADQRIQQLQQEVQQDPTRAQAANQEIQDIQNYVQAQTNTILKQAQTGEIQEANTNTQLPQFNSQMAHNTSNTEQQTVAQQNKLPIDTNDKVTNFRNSMANENISDTDGFYKSVEKIIKDKDYNVILDSSLTNEKGNPVNAVISNENGITIRINPQSERGKQVLLTHEITHGIETKEMSDLIMDYASKNEGFNEALQSLKKAYGTEDITPEVVADISGQLLGTQEFISELSTKNPNIFKQIYDKIIEIANKLTGNSKEALFVKDLKNKWEKAYRESNIQSAQQNLKEGAKYSQNAEVTDKLSEVKDYYAESFRDYLYYEASNNLSEEEAENFADLFYENDIKTYTDLQEIAEKKGVEIPSPTTKMWELTENIDDVDLISSKVKDSFDNMTLRQFIKEYKNTQNIEEKGEGLDDYEEISLEDAIQDIENYVGKKNIKTNKTTDNEGRKLSKGQQEKFKDSKIRDENGALVRVYHTVNHPVVQFNEFNPVGTPGYHFGKQVVIYTTNSKKMSGSYANSMYEMADTQKLESIQDVEDWFMEVGLPFYEINNNIVYDDEGTPILKYDSLNALLRNLKSDIQKELGGESELQYEMYLDIKNPYVVESEDESWKTVEKEFDEEKSKIIEAMQQNETEFIKLANESERKYEKYEDDEYWDINSLMSELEYLSDINSDLHFALKNGVFKKIKNYDEAQQKAKEFGIKLPDSNTKVKDLVEGFESKAKIYDDSWAKVKEDELNKMMNWTISDLIKNFYRVNQEWEDFGGSEYFWFATKFKEVLGDEFKEDIDEEDLIELFEIAQDDFDEDLIEEYTSKSLETNDVVKKVIKMNETLPDNEKYDGIIFKKIYDYAGAIDEWENETPEDVYVAFNSNQLKSIDNLDPTTDPDIRYSKKADKWQQWLESNFKSKGKVTYFKDDIGVTTAETVMRDFNEAKKGNLDNKKLRRHVKTSNEATGMEKSIEKADINKITYEVKSNKKLYAKAKSNLEGLSYEEKLARSKNLLNSGKKITDEDIVEAQIVELEAAKAGKIDDYLDIQQDIAIMGTEVGRVVQAMSLIRKMSPDGQIQTLMKIVNRKQKSGNKNYENVKLKPQLVKNVLDAYDDDTHTTFNQEKLDNAMDKLKQDVADQMKVTASEKLNEWRYLSMLGNPKTHVRNMVGNVAMSIVKGVKDIQSAALQDLLIRNPEGKTATLKRASNDVKALSDIAFNEMMDIDNKGNKYVDTDTIEQKRKIFNNKALEALRKFNLKALNVEDNIFKKAHFKKSFTSYLTAKGIKTAEDINNNPQIVADAKVYAMQQAKIATFQEENSIASWIKDLDQKGPVAKVVRGAVIPFTGVPLNIAKTGIEYTPGIGMGKVISDFKKAPKNQRGNVLIDGLSKQMTGTSLAILGYVLAKSGIVTADAGDDKEDKYLKDLGAKMNYSIKIGDTSYDLSWLSPSSMPFFVGASGYEQWEKKEGIDGNFIFDALASTLDPLSEMSVISSFTDVLSSYNQSEMGKIKDMGESMIQSYSSQFIPTLFSQFARTLDDTKRNTYADKNSQWTFGEETIKKLQYKIPGLRNMLPEQTDYLGNTKKENDNVIKRGIEAFLSPASTKKDTSDEVTKELVKLYDETGDTGVIPGKQDLYIKYQGEKYDLTQREYNQLKRDYGALVNTEVNRAINSNDYQNLSTNEQAEVISNIISYAGFKARNNYMESNGIDYTNSKYNTAKKAEDSGYAIADFYVTKRALKEDKQNTTLNDVNRYLELKEKGIDGKTFDEFKAFVKSAKATKTANGGYVRGSKKQKIINYINSLPLSASAKKALWDDYNNPNNQGYIQYYK